MGSTNDTSALHAHLHHHLESLNCKSWSTGWRKAISMPVVHGVVLEDMLLNDQIKQAPCPPKN